MDSPIGQAAIPLLEKSTSLIAVNPRTYLDLWQIDTIYFCWVGDLIRMFNVTA